MKTATKTNFTERYLDDRLVYDFNLTPADVPSLAHAYLRGINCTLLARFVQEDLHGYRLPEHLMCTEMFYDTEHFNRQDTVDYESLRAGDLLWFGKPASKEAIDNFVPKYNAAGWLLNWNDFPPYHVGVATGEMSEQGPVVLHAVEDENVTLWPLERFKDVRRYSVVWGVSRLKIADVTD